VPREKDYEKMIKLAGEAPPVGAYRRRYSHVDPAVASPRFGTEHTWGGHLKRKSMLIKEEDFR